MKIFRISRYFVFPVMLVMYSYASADSMAEKVEVRLQEHPTDPTILYREARVLHSSGNTNGALDILNRLRTQYPEDVDYMLARAQVFAAQQRDEAALNELRKAIAVAPHYEAVWRLHFSLLLRQYDNEAREEQARLLPIAAERFPNAEWWQQEYEAAYWSLHLGAAHENLSNDLPGWGDQFVEVSRNLVNGQTYRAGFTRHSRFDNADISLTAAANVPLGAHWIAGADLSFSNTADFQPRHAYSAHITRSLRNGWVTDLRYRRRAYQSATVDSGITTLEKYVGQFRVAYAVSLSRLHGATTTANHSATVNWYYSENASIGLSFNSGEEAEAIANNQVLQTDVQGVTVSGRRRLNERFGLAWWLGTHEQGSFYRRRYLGMAVSIRL